MSIWKYFSYETDPALRCPCCKEEKMDDAFMRKWDAIREEAGFPLVVTSGYRCPVYNQAVSSTGADGPHTTGRSLDIHVIGDEVYKLIPIMIKHGMTGIGIKQKGDYRGRFIHGDDLGNYETKGPRPWVWTY